MGVDVDEIAVILEKKDVLRGEKVKAILGKYEAL